MTIIGEAQLRPGQSVRVDVAALAGGGASVTLSAVRAPLLVGIEGPSGARTQSLVQAYPQKRGSRDFGVKRPGESLPSLSPHTGGKLKDLPRTCEPWCSFKHQDVERVKPWLDTMPPAEQSFPTYKLTYHHEPHGDAGMTPAVYRPRLARTIAIVRAHKNAARISGVGPIVTGYWIRERKGNPLDWWVDGATVYGVDVYEPEDATKPWTPAQMFDPVLERLYAVLPEDVEICLPEYGRRLGAGKVRAEGIDADFAYLTEHHPRVTRVYYYNNPAYPQFAIADDSPESQVLRRWMAEA